MTRSRPERGAAARYRRSPHLVAYWQDGSLLVCNYATRQVVEAAPLVFQILQRCSGWTSVADLRTALALSGAASLPVLLSHLVERGLLEERGRPVDPKAQAMARLEPWNPHAGFFHTFTRDVPFASAREANRFWREQAKLPGAPAPVKRYRGVKTIDLPPPRMEGEFPSVLTARRTWRRYSKAPVTVDELATILGLAAGVQYWVKTGREETPLKTSPSGGARHPIETYVAVRDVRGLRSGIYHYAADRHALERIGKAVSIERLREYLPNSGYFADASAMVFFTAVFERILWRYRYARAYRAALVEAGHVCQTFCLTATWLNLAPYCIMGLADSEIERDLGLDGITESVLYAAGVGRPPARTLWAPRRRGTLIRRPNKPVNSRKT